MSDDRFNDVQTRGRHVTTQSHINAPLSQGPEASGASKEVERVTLEECAERALREGREADLVGIIQLLPEARREVYRALWKRVKGVASA